MAGPHGAGTGPLEIAAHELCGVLDALAEQTAVDWGRAGLVEVYLPLLAHELPVDAWEFDNAGLTEPLGAAVQLVVRSTERCVAPDTLFLTEADRRYHRQWRERLSDRLDARAHSTVVPWWCEDSTVSLTARVSSIRQSSANALCAIGMSQQDTEHRRARLLPAFVAAAPTCVWSRDDHADTGLRKHLEPLVTEATLGDLPGRVRDARGKSSAAAPNQPCTGHHLTLVIDHPDAFIDPPRFDDPQYPLPDSDETAT